MCEIVRSACFVDCLREMQTVSTNGRWRNAVSLPTSDAQSPQSWPHHPKLTPPLRANPTTVPSSLPQTAHLMSPPSSSTADLVEDDDYDRAIDFASHSWDLATGGLKTLTAKREFPSLIDRRPTSVMPDAASAAPRTSIFLLVILICVILMLISGGIILFIMLQS